jgi:hypothetical protein
MSMFIATQVTAVATLALAVLAAFASLFAFLAFIWQRKEVRALQTQVIDQENLTKKQIPVLESQASELEASWIQRERETEDRRIAYVSLVFIWEERLMKWGAGQAEAPNGNRVPADRRAYVKNVGPLPVYDVTISWRNGTEMEHQECKTTPLMPGDDPWEVTRHVPDGSDPENFTVVAFVRDAYEQIWRIDPHGRHDEIPRGREPPRSW